MDAFRDKLEEQIAEYGWAILSTGTETAAGEISMAYTIGLAEKGLPEIVVFGLPQRVAQIIAFTYHF